MFRLDRFLTLSFFGPLAKLASPKGLRIPILMYHSISSDIEQGVHPYYRVVTTPEVFARQMTFLAEEGYQVIGLETAARLLSGETDVHDNGQRSIPEKPVVITFDDGFLDFYTHAFPVLSGHGFTASVFLPTSFIGSTDKTIAGRPFLSWSQVREMIPAGITFGSHTASHGDLLTMKRSEVKDELQRSRETIEEKTGMPVHAFSFPYAFPEHKKEFVAFLRKELKKNGYRYAITTSIGTAVMENDAFFLKRIPINVHDDVAFFKAKMAGAYDWIHSLQYSVKSLRGMFGMRRRRSLAQWIPPQ